MHNITRLDWMREGEALIVSGGKESVNEEIVSHVWKNERRKHSNLSAGMIRKNGLIDREFLNNMATWVPESKEEAELEAQVDNHPYEIGQQPT